MTEARRKFLDLLNAAGKLSEAEREELADAKLEWRLIGGGEPAFPGGPRGGYLYVPPIPTVEEWCLSHGYDASGDPIAPTAVGPPGQEHPPFTRHADGTVIADPGREPEPQR